MKKLMFLIVALMMINLANAQDLSYRWGVKGGLNLSQINLEDLRGQFYTSGMKFGFHLGGVAEYLFNDALAIQPSLLFMQNSSDNSRISVKMNQIQFPVNLKYTYKFTGFNMYMLAGPYLGYILSATEKGLGEHINLFDKATNSEPMRHIDYGLSIGAGVVLNGNIDVGFGYQLGLANIFPGNNYNRLSIITLSANYFFE